GGSVSGSGCQGEVGPCRPTVTWQRVRKVPASALASGAGCEFGTNGYAARKPHAAANAMMRRQTVSMRDLQNLFSADARWLGLAAYGATHPHHQHKCF